MVSHSIFSSYFFGKLNLVCSFAVLALISISLLLCFCPIAKTEDCNDKEDRRITYYLERAKCLENLLIDKEPDRYLALFPCAYEKDTHIEFIIDNGVIKNNAPIAKDNNKPILPPYSVDISIYGKNTVYPYPFADDQILIDFYSNGNSYTISYYREKGESVNGDSMAIQFFPNQKLKWFHYSKRESNAKTKEIEKKWSEGGSVVSEKNFDFLPKIPITAKSPNKIKMVKEKDFPVLLPIFPNNNRKELQKFFKRLEKIYSAKSLIQLAEMLDAPRIKNLKPAASLNYVAGKKREINIFGYNENNDSVGYFLSLDEQGNVLSYCEGEGRIEGFMREKVRHLLIHLHKGTEVKFHSTGYPATYKTIVKSRLFGRQIEWNAQGEVISDVDLDIPKPWADAPKKEGEKQNAKDDVLPFRKWSYTFNGKPLTVIARLISVDSDKVTLETEKGKTASAGISIFSQEDRDYIKQILQKIPKEGTVYVP